MESYKSNSLNIEVYMIKKYYCSKCKYFNEDSKECTKKKILKKCLKENERIIKNSNM